MARCGEKLEALVNWICHDCATARGSRLRGVATFHEDVCDWCGELKSTTEPRDYTPRPAHPEQVQAMRALADSGQALEADLDAIGRAWAAERRRTGRK